MATVKTLCFTFISLSMISVTVACSCTITWNCENEKKTVFTESDMCNLNYVSSWYLKGNKLRGIPVNPKVSHPIEILDLSDNELGLGEIKYNFSLFNKMNYFDVSANSLTDLKFLTDDSGRYECQIQNLVATRNRISSILDVNVCSKLRWLNLTDNNITSIPDLSFAIETWQEKMIEIHLSGNPIASIGPLAFENMNATITLSLSNTRVLRELPPSIFEKIPKLENLFLDGNKLHQLPSVIFRTTKNLRVLHLQDNRLTSLPQGIFNNTGNLRSLDLDDNVLQELSSQTFAHLHSLRELSVRNNLIKAIPSLLECGSPLVSVLFNNNDIHALSETAVRALLRYGFELGDLTSNPIAKVSTQWLNGTTDLQVQWNEQNEEICGSISLLDVSNHGIVKFCIAGYLKNSTQESR